MDTINAIVLFVLNVIIVFNMYQETQQSKEKGVHPGITHLTYLSLLKIEQLTELRMIIFLKV